MNALAILQEYGPQAVAALGGVAGVAKGGAWVVQRAVEARRTKREADAAWRDEVRAGIKACSEAVASMSERVAAFGAQLDAHDARTAETAALVREAREDLAELRGEMIHRVGRAENDAGTARHVASEADALARHAVQTLDTINGGPTGPRTRGGG